MSEKEFIQKHNIDVEKAICGELVHQESDLTR